jgi:chemotaxis protein CheZ
MSSDAALRQGAEALERERRELAGIVAAARQALSEAAPAALRATTLPSAMAEIAAIAEGGETAADQIVTSVDGMLQAKHLPQGEYVELVNRNCMQILEACAFQDLSGQRISKLVAMLLLIEDRLGGLEAALGAPLLTETDDNAANVVAAKGPALPGEGFSQDDVDRLFA